MVRAVQREGERGVPRMAHMRSIVYGRSTVVPFDLVAILRDEFRLLECEAEDELIV